MFAEIVPEIKVSNKTEFMIGCQLATGSESPQLGSEQQHQLPHLLLNWKGALLAYKCFTIFVYCYFTYHFGTLYLHVMFSAH